MSKKIRKGLLACLFLPVAVFGRGEPPIPDTVGAGAAAPIKVQYGIASYYSNKFEGRTTYTDEIFPRKN